MKNYGTNEKVEFNVSIHGQLGALHLAKKIIIKYKHIIRHLILVNSMS